MKRKHLPLSVRVEWYLIKHPNLDRLMGLILYLGTALILAWLISEGILIYKGL